MNRGFSIFGRQPRVEPAPASLTGAQNGLSQVGSNVELGGNPLIHLTSFDTGGFAFQILEGGSSIFLLTPGGLQFGTPYVGGLYSGIEMVGNRMDLIAGSSGERYIELEDTNKTVTLGDVDGVISGTRIVVDNLSNEIVSRNNDGIMLQMTANSEFLFGDINAFTNGMILEINNTTENIEFNHNAGTFFRLDFSNQTYSIGDFLGNQSGISLSLNNIAGIASIGDLTNSGNGTSISLDDTTGVISISNIANTAALNINGTAGFTGTVVAPATITVNGGIVTNVA